MKAVKSEGATRDFTWIGSDGWSSRALVYQPGKDDPGGFEDQVQGTISIQPMAKDIPGFREYFSRIHLPKHTEINPWFYEYWEAEFGCRFPSKDQPLTPFNKNYSKECTGKEGGVDYPYDYEPQLQFVSDAVLLFAHAIKRHLLELCPHGDEKCVRNQYPSEKNSFDQTKHLNGTRLKEILQTTEFDGIKREHPRLVVLHIHI